MPNQINPNLNELEKKVMFEKATELAFSGKYDKHFGDGVYICKNCRSELYYSKDKFNSGCGWTAFDDEVAGAVQKIPDSDGRRIEIVCNNCGIHLGHIFTGERLTTKNIRHCVNSVSLEFVPVEELN
jgi:peptide methionine sulfoxide reductase msrA/msrB